MAQRTSDDVPGGQTRTDEILGGPGPRWKLLVTLCLVVIVPAVAALIWVWLRDSPQRQDRVTQTMLVVLLSFVGLSLWFSVWLLLLSRLPWKRRLMGLGALLLLGVGAASSVRLRGVSGDVVPVLDWRWAREPGEIERSAPTAALATAGARTLASEHDYPQFLGPRGDGTVPGIRLARDWSEPPRELWRRTIGAGWSGFAVAGDFAVTQDQRGEEETVTAYDLRTGEVLWAHSDTARWEDPLGGIGPRATPAIRDGRVYALGGTGILNVLDLETGRVVWSKDVLTDNGSSAPEYGVSSSPLLLEDRVVVAAGGLGASLVAYAIESGDTIWAAGDDRAAYSSPMLARFGAERRLLILTQRNLVAHDPVGGEVAWSHPWPGETQNVAQPVVLGTDRIFVSSGYGVGGKLFRLRGGSDGGEGLGLVWETLGLKAKFTNVVLHDGFLYGLDDGILVCLETTTGERRWKRGRYGHGQIMLVDDLILVLAENGTVALVEASPEGFVELGSFAALRGKTWNHPALAGPYLLVRNDREAAAFELPLEAGSTP